MKMHGNFSKIHNVIQEEWYAKIFVEYKTSRVRDFCGKYHVCAKTLQKIFGPKMTPSKKRMVEILKNEWMSGKVREIAEKNIL